MAGGRPAQTEAPAFGKRLAALRKQAGLSQADFAEKLEIKRPMVDHYERRSPNPTAEFVIKAAAVLGCTTDELLGVATKSTSKAGRKSKLDQYMEQVKQLPRAEQQYVVKFLEQVLG